MKLSVPDGLIVDASGLIHAEQGDFSPHEVNAFLDGELVERCECCKVGKNGYAVIITNEIDETGEQLKRVTKHGVIHLEPIK